MSIVRVGGATVHAGEVFYEADDTEKVTQLEAALAACDKKSRSLAVELKTVRRGRDALQEESKRESSRSRSPEDYLQMSKPASRR
jgi:hypothetical protein